MASQKVSWLLLSSKDQPLLLSALTINKPLALFVCGRTQASIVRIVVPGTELVRTRSLAPSKDKAKLVLGVGTGVFVDVAVAVGVLDAV